MKERIESLEAEYRELNAEISYYANTLKPRPGGPPGPGVYERRDEIEADLLRHEREGLASCVPEYAERRRLEIDRRLRELEGRRGPGRPALQEGEVATSVLVRVPPFLRARIDEARGGESISSWLRDAAERKLAGR